MEYIRVTCTKCGKTLQAPASAAGKTAPCPNCKQLITIPGAQVTWPQQQPRTRPQEPVEQYNQQHTQPYPEPDYRKSPPQAAQQQKQQGGRQWTVNMSRNCLYVAMAILVALLTLLVLTIVHLTKPAPPTPEASAEEVAPPAFVPQPHPVEDLTPQERKEYLRLVERRIRATSESELSVYFERPEFSEAMDCIILVMSHLAIIRSWEKLNPGRKCPGEGVSWPDWRILKRFAPDAINHRRLMFPID